MSKHLIKYTTQEEYDEVIDNSILELPNCVLIENDKKFTIIVNFQLNYIQSQIL